MTTKVTRVALVSGASQGIGKAIAIRLAADGNAVALTGRNIDKLRGVERQIREAGGTAQAFALDVTDNGNVERTFTDIQKSLGAVEVLVNNAGITGDGLLLRMSLDSWESVLRTNLTGAFLLSRVCLFSMIRLRRGRIINIASIVGQIGQVGQANYAASKAGVIALTKSLAREVASRGVTVNAVSPGYIETAMTEVLSARQKATNLAHVPLGRVGTAEEVASAVAFLASEESGYITGHTLDINGGMFMN